MPAFERINAVVSISLIGLALYFVLDFPIQLTEVMLLGSPVNIVSPRQNIMVLLLGGLVMAGMDAIARAHPALPTKRLSYLATFWGPPGLLMILATQTLGLAPNLVTWVAGLIGVGLLLWITLLVEYLQVPDQTSLPKWARVWQNFMGYAVALLLFIIIYQTRNRSILTATAILMVSTLIAAALLRQRSTKISKSWLFAAVIGLSLGQLTWALNYWRTGALNAGLLLFVAFYVLVGLAYQYLHETLSQRTLWEFGTIAFFGLLAVFYL